MPMKSLMPQEATLLTHPYKWETAGWTGPAMEQVSLSGSDGWSITGVEDQPFEFIVYNSSANHVITVHTKNGAAGSSTSYTNNNPWCAILPRETAHFAIDSRDGQVSIGIFHENQGTQTIFANIRYSNCAGAAAV